jgi:endonuclease YncB( thermonuclease family)
MSISVPLIALAACLATAAPSASPVLVGASEFSGVAHVIDGDTIDVGRYRVRLQGLEPPDAGQRCSRGVFSYRCADLASDYLHQLLDNRLVYCRVHGRDRLRRSVATCYVDGIDIAEAMVRAGYAAASARYSQRYVEAEADARSSRRGLWSNGFLRPEEWRRSQE